MAKGGGRGLGECYIISREGSVVKGKNVKKSIAVNGTPSHSYGVSLAVWDHTVLPATCVTCYITLYGGEGVSKMDIFLLYNIWTTPKQR